MMELGKLVCVCELQGIFLYGRMSLVGEVLAHMIMQALFVPRERKCVASALIAIRRLKFARIRHFRVQVTGAIQ
jgi:hypothetical protein